MSDFFFDSFDEFWLLYPNKYPDGLGGHTVEWVELEKVKMRLDLGSAKETREAMAMSLKTVFTASFPANTPVISDSYLKNVETGEIFRIIGNPQDNLTAPIAKYPSGYANAERTTLPR